jgi:hypothetical protein
VNMVFIETAFGTSGFLICGLFDLDRGWFY